MSFWNEYMTVDGPDGQRRGTFPDLIMTFDSQTGRPTPTSDLKQGQEVYLIHVGYQHLKLAAPMFDKDLLAGVEKIRLWIVCHSDKEIRESMRKAPPPKYWQRGLYR